MQARLLPNSLTSLRASVSLSLTPGGRSTRLTGLLGRLSQLTHGKVFGPFLALTVLSVVGYSYYCDFDAVEFQPLWYKQRGEERRPVSHLQQEPTTHDRTVLLRGRVMGICECGM